MTVYIVVVHDTILDEGFHLSHHSFLEEGHRRFDQEVSVSRSRGVPVMVHLMSIEVGKTGYTPIRKWYSEDDTETQD